MATTVKPQMDASERAARDLLNQTVKDGILDRRNANQVLKTGLPFIRTMLATWRKDGCSPEWITAEFQRKLTLAKTQHAEAKTTVVQHLALTRIVCAEMYLAVWGGMQEDLGQFTAARNAANTAAPAPAPEVEAPDPAPQAPSTPASPAANRAQEHADRLRAEADRKAAAASAKYERFSGGQPLLRGHHSYRGALRDRNRADNATRRAIEASEDAKRAQGKANGARIEAELAAVVAAQSRPWERSDFRVGDIVSVRTHQINTDLYRVKRVNAKTLTLEGPGGGMDDPKRTYDRVLSRTRDGVTTTSPDVPADDTAPVETTEPTTPEGPAMYRIAIVRKGRPAERSTVDSGGALRDAVWALIRSEGGTITDADHSELIALVSDARSLADIEGFAALEFGTASLTICPAEQDDPTMPEPTLFDPQPTTDVPDPGQRIAFTGDGRHWHGTVTRNDLTGPDHTPRLSVEVDPGNDALSSVVYRLGEHFRSTHQGETCPDCGHPDRGPAMYSRI